ncbi:hypothetical protein FIA58_003300 [Flavobacterium jejuense]|uniref:Uncharacterized protein n=1 Tax=Flavobacterium jejuense TaxID=1544455 RepID=A0ABX0ILL4_9FLAO|nr:hypothetical protein [Flavobacterium jejuense]NHN24692.1 hypothetical protein [Flavobacterium jejuense]
MKKRSVFNKKLLITYDEMAMLLQTTRTQWSMFQIRQRSLPDKSMDRLVALVILSNSISVDSSSKKEEVLKQEATKKKLLEVDLKEVLYKQKKFERKLNQSKEKYEAAMNTLDFVEVVQTQKENDYFEAGALGIIKTNAIRTLKTHSLLKLTQLEIKLASLQLEKELIEKAIE